MRAWWGLVGVLLGACEKPAAPPRADRPASAVSSSPAAPSTTTSAATPRTATPTRLPALVEVLRARHPDLFAHADEHRLQLVVRWERDGSLHREAFRADAEYVYPASAIKPVAAVAALRLLRRRWPSMPPGGRGVSLERCLDAECEQRAGRVDAATTIDATLRDSDNAGLAWLFDLVGRDALHGPFWSAGLRSLRFHHRMGETSAQGRSAPPLRVTLGADAYVTHPAYAPELPPHPVGGALVGDGQKKAGAILDRPMSFATKNYLSLDDAQRLLIALAEPRLAEGDLDLDPRDRAFLVGVMSAPPTKPGAHRPLTPGLERVPGGGTLQQVTKSGRAYGFTFVNVALRSPAGPWAFVTASVYANPNGIVNDDAYGYGQTLPFLADLGEMMAHSLLVPRPRR